MCIQVIGSTVCFKRQRFLHRSGLFGVSVAENVMLLAHAIVLGHVYCAVYPPSTTIPTPAMKLDIGLARKEIASAISSISPNRC